MADASHTQTSFLGGEVSQWSQGQFDQPWYKTALNRCFNIWPTDEGAAPRRPGTRFLGYTRQGKAGRVMPFTFSEATPYNIELTDDMLRMWNDTRLVTTNDSQTVTNISNTSPAVFSLLKAVNWKTGDGCYFNFTTPQQAFAGANIANRQCTLTMLSTTSFTVADAVTGVDINASDILSIPNTPITQDGSISSGPISDSAISASPVTRQLINTLSPTVNHINEIVTPYSVASADWHNTTMVQGYDLGIFLNGTVSPQGFAVITQPTDNNFANFEFKPAQFIDGPYLDPPHNAIATTNNLTAIPQITVGYAQWVNNTVYGINVPVSFNGQDYISLTNNNVGNEPDTSTNFWQQLPLGSMVNNGNGFVSTDIGRFIRLFTQPQIWSPSATYAAGNSVTYNDEYFVSLAGSNANNQPDISLTQWVLNPSGAIWTWGIITAINSANNITIQIQGAPLLYQAPILTWQLGAWSNTTGWPTVGCYQGGRIWYGGAIPNRFDASISNQPFNMAPTEQDGTVDDSSAITYTLNAQEQNPIFWMQADEQGVLVGTQECEWLIYAPNSGPITASNIDARRKTKYGSKNALAVRTGLTICFIKRYGKRLIEYLADAITNRFFGFDLSKNARHLASRGLEEIAYQEELVPTVWARCEDGTLVGTTYRRVSQFSTQPPEFNGWHQHALGSARFIESCCVGPSMDGTQDALAVVTNDLNNNVRFVEQMTTLRDETEPVTTSWYLDCAVTAPAAQLVGNNVVFSGLNYLNGQKVAVFAASIDCGDYIVSQGQVSVPLGYTCPITGWVFNEAAFKILQPKVSDFSGIAVQMVFKNTIYTIPCVIGFNYESQGQLCRPQLPQDTGARNGPGFGKKRRQAQFAVQTVNSIGTRIGTNFNKMVPAPFNKIDAGGRSLPYLDTFTGIIADTLENDHSYDSMLTWKANRPYPTTVTVLGGFIQTQDK